MDMSLMEARAGLSNFRAKLLERASVLTDRLAAQPLYKAVLAVAVASAMLLLVTAINDGIKGHATRVLIADSELAAHATLKIYVADVPDEVSNTETAALLQSLPSAAL